MDATARRPKLMTDFILAYIQYAAQGPQECLVAMCLPGFFMLVFGEKRKPVKAKPAPIKQRNAKRKAGNVAKVKPPKKAKAVNVKEPEAKRVERELSREEMDRLDRYYSERRI